MVWRRRIKLASLGVFTAVVVLNLVLASFAWIATHPGGWVGLGKPRHYRTPESMGLKAEEVRSGESFAWRLPGEGKGTVLLFHGFGGTAANTLDEGAFFQKLGFSAVCIDFPNAGASGGTATTIGWKEGDVVAAWAAAERGPIVLFGQSMGSAAILRAVGALGVEADALILENPYDRLVTTVGNRFERMHLPAFPGANLLTFWGGVELGFDGFALNPIDYAAKVHVPTLMLTGARDDRVKLAEAKAIDAALAGSHHLEVFPTAGHGSMRAADKARWGKVVTRFLATE